MLQKLRDVLFRPSSRVEEVGERRRAELLASISLVFASLNILGLLIAWAGSNRAGRLELVALVMIGGIPYLISRTRFYKVGIFIFITAFMTNLLLYTFVGTPRLDLDYALALLVPPVFVLGMALLDFREMIILVLITLSGVIVFSHIHSEIVTLMPTIGVLACLGSLTLVAQYHRERVEKERIENFSKTNENLKHLRSDLEKHIDELRQAQDSLQVSQETMREFQDKLKNLHEVSLELSQIEDRKEFFRRAIELGREELGFDRLGLFMLGEGNMMLAIYGVDPDGNIRDMSDFQYPLENDPPIWDLVINNPGKRVLLATNIHERLETIGTGWNAITPIWDGDRPIGILAADNFVKHEPYQPYIEELILLYGVTLGNLIRRRDAETELRFSEEKFSKAFRFSPDAIAITTVEDGKLVEANHGFENLFGYKREEIINHSMAELDIWMDAEQHETLMKILTEKGAFQNREIRHVTRDGRVKISLGSAEKIEVAEKPYILWVNHDITDQKQVETEIKRLNEELEERVRERTAQLEKSNQELEAFTYSVSHDLRAPLRAMNGYTKIILDDFSDQLSPEIKSYLDRAYMGANRMGILIDDLLSFSRLGRQEIHKQKVIPLNIIKQVLEDLQPEQSERQMEIVIGELPPCYADPALLRQVYTNLIGNALKFTRGREPTRIEIGTEKNEAEMVYFVQDNGTGFDMVYADKLFGVFQRLHRQDEFEGTGVGLAIVHRIIERHGGRVWAEARPDEGATFRFTLGTKGPEYTI